MFDDFTAMAAEARYEAVKESKGKGIKILTPKQMLQRLQIAHLHMEKQEMQHISYSKKIRRIVYSFYLTKKSPKKYIII